MYYENRRNVESILKDIKVGFVAVARIVDYVSIISISRDRHAKSFKKLLYNFIAIEFKLQVVDLFEDTFLFFGSETENVDSLVEEVRVKVFSYGLSEMMLPIRVSLRIGYSLFCHGSTSSFENALFAMHAACVPNKSICSYADCYTEIQRFRMRSLRAAYIYDAIKSDNFDLGFQPVIDSRSGHILYYEALLRISKSDEQFSIAECVKALEQEEFIGFIDEKIITKVLEELKRSESINLAVNVSAFSVASDSWSKICLELISKTKVADRLVIEITETALKSDCNKIKRFLSVAKELGCKIAIDDFGSGYNSIEHLAVFDVDFVKIDGSIISNIEKNKKNRFVVEILTKIAKEFNLRIVAECVESFGCVRILEDMGVSLMQGNYFSPVLKERAWASI